MGGGVKFFFVPCPMFIFVFLSPHCFESHINILSLVIRFLKTFLSNYYLVLSFIYANHYQFVILGVRNIEYLLYKRLVFINSPLEKCILSLLLEGGRGSVNNCLCPHSSCPI